MNTTTIPAWFAAEIRTGIATLYTMSLEGCPAADVVTATANLWVSDLWSDRRCDWHESDAERIRNAFHRLRTNSRRWPQMSDFMAFLPARQISDATALPKRVFTEAERVANLRRLRELGLSLLDGKKDEASA